jgi:hypothetical protein
MGEYKSSSTILDRSAGWRGMVSFMLQMLYSFRKELPVSIKKQAGWASEPVITLWRREKSLALTRNQTIHDVAHYCTN